ncbi:hypothetical protein FSP39_002803 [Pinctada imbricata]|uniref:Uncharacterized protein n=1 Tax=Pinctada imbricata TaxID=66713 RepID=A0AA89BND5_PINIB|nr:hypothetical protein FSP39_002803 [Pinctada imbricata]
MDVDNIHGTALHEAANKHDLAGMECILNSKQCPINSQDHAGRTPLHCILDDEEFDDLDELQYALSLLKNYGADINLKDYNERTPLHYVFSTYVKWIPDIVTFCYRTFPDVDPFAKDRDGNIIFHMFVSDLGDNAKERDDLDDILQGREHFIKEFINGKIIELSAEKIERVLNSKDNSGYSAFQTYIGGDFYSLSTIKMFIQNGADVNSKSFLGNTALMKSTFLDRLDISEILLHAGADPNATNIFEQTALFGVKSSKSFCS